MYFQSSKQPCRANVITVSTCEHCSWYALRFQAQGHTTKKNLRNSSGSDNHVAGSLWCLGSCRAVRCAAAKVLPATQLHSAELSCSSLFGGRRMLEDSRDTQKCGRKTGLRHFLVPQPEQKQCLTYGCGALQPQPLSPNRNSSAALASVLLRVMDNLRSLETWQSVLAEVLDWRLAQCHRLARPAQVLPAERTRSTSPTLTSFTSGGPVSFRSYTRRVSWRVFSLLSTTTTTTATTTTTTTTSTTTTNYYCYYDDDYYYCSYGTKVMARFLLIMFSIF